MNGKIKWNWFVMCLFFCMSITICFHSIKVNAAADNKKGELKVTFLYVGQGDCALLESEGKTMLIDAGKNEYGSTVTQYLQDNGIEYLDYVVETHDDPDHIGGLYDVLNHIQVGKIYRTSLRYNDSDNSAKVNKLISDKKISTTVPATGQKITFGSAEIQFIAPNSSYYSVYNNYSIVMRIVNGENSFLFTGDAEEQSEEEMIQSGYTLKSDVLKVGHHGALTSTSQEFLDAVDPTISVISCDSSGAAGLPRMGTIKKLTGTNIYRTDICGNITMTSDGTNISVDKGAYFYANSTFASSTGKIVKTIEEESDLLDNISVSSDYSDIQLCNVMDDEDYDSLITEPLTLSFSADAGVYQVDSIEYALVDGGDDPDIDNMEWNDTDNGTVTLTDDFLGCIYVKFENQLGNVVIRKTTGFQLDCTAPEDTKVTSNVTGLSMVNTTETNTYRGYSVTNPVISFSCDYGISGEGSIEYMLVNRGDAFNESNAWTIGSGLVLTDDFIGRIYVRFTDGAGNTVIMKTKGFKWIQGSPINTAVSSANANSNVVLINYSGVSPNTAVLSYKNSTLSFSADFGYGGKESIRYQLVETGNKYASSGKWVTASKVTLAKGFTGTVYVKFTDKAGHSVVKKTNKIRVK